MNDQEKKQLMTSFSSAFSEAHEGLLRTVESVGLYRKYAIEDFLFRQGTFSEGVFCMLSGKVKTINKVGTKEQIINLSAAGDLIGVHAATHDCKHIKSAQALEDSELCFIPKTGFLDMIHTYPGIAPSLLKHMHEDIDEIENRALMMVRRPTRERLANAILILEKKFGLKDNAFIDVRFTPLDFANFISTTRTTVYRTLKHFEEEGLISLHKHRIRLLNREGLKGMVRL